jgi:hypothetical protein
MKKSSGSQHVIGVPVTSTAYAIEDTSTRDRPAANKDGDRLAVSLTHPSPYTSFGYKHSTLCTRPGPQACCRFNSLLNIVMHLMLIRSSHTIMLSRQQGSGDPLGEQAGETSSELQGPW